MIFKFRLRIACLMGFHSNSAEPLPPCNVYPFTHSGCDRRGSPRCELIEWAVSAYIIHWLFINTIHRNYAPMNSIKLKVQSKMFFEKCLKTISICYSCDTEKLFAVLTTFYYQILYCWLIKLRTTSETCLLFLINWKSKSNVEKQVKLVRSLRKIVKGLFTSKGLIN